MPGKKIDLVPFEVSPLIKLVRWTCLIAGVIHGFVLRREYTAVEKVQREYEEARRVAREEYLAREKQRRNAVEMRELERIFLGTVASDKEVSIKQVPSDTNKIIKAKANGKEVVIVSND